MKRATIFLAALLAALMQLSAQNVVVWQNGQDTKLGLSELRYSNAGATLAIGDQTYETSAIDSITFAYTIGVVYNGNSAQVTIPAGIANSVTATVDGAHVTLTNTDTSQEHEFRISGQTDNGSLTYVGTYKSTLVFDNLSLTNATGAAVDIQCGKRVNLNLIGQNTLADGAGTQKAALYCKGHLELGGGGDLAVSSVAAHAIATKEYLQLKRTCGNITIVKAVKDAIHCGQYFQMNGGRLLVDVNTLGDGVQVDTTDDPTDERNGQILVKGGTIDITVVSEDCKAMKCDSLVTISGGTLHLVAKGNGTRGIQTDFNMVIGEEDGPTSITVSAEGGRCTLPECEADPHRCMGIKVDGILTMNAGTMTVTNSGPKSRGVKCGMFVHNGGTYDATIVN
ncbi:MAG: carbohydrate-binding domain-containing protein [Bacteroidaceae bacterium]|nr:carbohydrate-binding domain-containing protein [Bacteroidaceae bacterium]